MKERTLVIKLVVLLMNVYHAFFFVLNYHKNNVSTKKIEKIKKDMSTTRFLPFRQYTTDTPL